MEKTELEKKLAEILTNLTNYDDESDSLQLLTFKNKYNKNDDTWNYPSYKIAIKKNDLTEYLSILLRITTNILNKYQSIENFNLTNGSTILQMIDLEDDKSIYKDNIINFIEHITNCNSTSIKSVKNNANYVAVSADISNDEIIIITKGTPFIKANGLIFQYDDEDLEIKPGRHKNLRKVNNLFKLQFNIASVIINKKTYIFNPIIGLAFGFDNVLKANMEESLKELKDADILDAANFAKLEEYSNKGKNYYGYSNFDKSKIDAIKNKNPEIVKVFKQKNIEFENDKPQLDDDKKILAFKKIICNDIKGDIVKHNKLYDSPGNVTF